MENMLWEIQDMGSGGTSQLQLLGRHVPSVFSVLFAACPRGYLWRDLQRPAQEEQEETWGLGGGGPAPEGHAGQHAPDSATYLALGIGRRYLEPSVGPAYCSGATTKPPPLVLAGCQTSVREHFRS